MKTPGLILLMLTACLAKPGGPRTPAYRSKQIDYRINPQAEEFALYRPPNHNSQEPWGLVVYISPADSCPGPPEDWKAVLSERKLLWVAPQRAGNQQPSPRRMGLAVQAALAVSASHKINPRRTYAAGLSGGARTAGALGFYQGDLFRGTIQDCGADFYYPLTEGTDSNGNPYGANLQPTSDEIDRARSKVKFCLISGPNDFRYPNIAAIFKNGFQKEKFRCKFLVDPKMGHHDCSADYLRQALDFLDP
jgi:hypothetical protein